MSAKVRNKSLPKYAKARKRYTTLIRYYKQKAPSV